MTLAIFRDTMTLLGIKDLPDDFVLRIHVKGSAIAPQVQFFKYALSISGPMVFPVSGPAHAF